MSHGERLVAVLKILSLQVLGGSEFPEQEVGELTGALPSTLTRSQADCLALLLMGLC